MIQMLLFIEFSCRFHVEGFGEYADGIFHLISGGHLDLPLAGLTVAGHKVGVQFMNLLKQWCADRL